MTVRALVRGKQSEVKTVSPTLRIEAATALLHQHRIGAMPVLDEDGDLVGIVSERDIIAEIARLGTAALTRQVRDVMTRNVITVTPDHSLKEVMQIMTTKRIRHLPVVEGGRLLTVISIGDVLKQRLDSARMEMNVLREVAIARA